MRFGVLIVVFVTVAVLYYFSLSLSHSPVIFSNKQEIDTKQRA